MHAQVESMLVLGCPRCWLHLHRLNIVTVITNHKVVDGSCIRI